MKDLKCPKCGAVGTLHLKAREIVDYNIDHVLVTKDGKVLVVCGESFDGNTIEMRTHCSACCEEIDDQALLPQLRPAPTFSEVMFKYRNKLPNRELLKGHMKLAWEEVKMKIDNEDWSDWPDESVEPHGLLLIGWDSTSGKIDIIRNGKGEVNDLKSNLICAEVEVYQDVNYGQLFQSIDRQLIENLMTQCSDA